MILLYNSPHLLQYWLLYKCTHFWLNSLSSNTFVVFQVRGTITTSSSSCSPSCWWEPGCSTVVSRVSDSTYSGVKVSATVLHSHWIHMPVLCVFFQTGRLTACCITRSRACGAWCPSWSAAPPGCSASSCWPSITPAGLAWCCCCSSTRWPAARSLLMTFHGSLRSYEQCFPS